MEFVALFVLRDFIGDNTKFRLGSNISMHVFNRMPLGTCKLM